MGAGMVTYDLPEHAHRFAVWAAARAAQRGLKDFSITRIRAAIEVSGIREIVADQSRWPTTAAEVDALHRRWARLMLRRFEQDGLKQVTYGRCALLIAVYLKTSVVLPRPEHPFAALAHPPIDRKVLAALVAESRFRRDARTIWRSNWTELDEAAYFRLIGSLRNEELDRPAFWTLEDYWQPEE